MTGPEQFAQQLLLLALEQENPVACEALTRFYGLVLVLILTLLHTSCIGKM